MDLSPSVNLRHYNECTTALGCSCVLRSVADTTQVISLSNAKGMRADILSLGAIVQRLIVPDKDGKPVDVALGMATPQEYLVRRPQQAMLSTGACSQDSLWTFITSLQ